MGEEAETPWEVPFGELAEFSLSKASSGFYWITPEGEFVNTNENFQEMLGYSEDKLKEMHVWDIASNFSEEDREEFWNRLKEEKTWVHKSKFETKDGVVFPVEITSHFIEYGDGMYFEFAFVRNITKHKETEEKFEEKDRQLETLLKNLPGMAYRCLNNKKYTMKFVSERCDEVTGYNPEELIDDNELPFGELIVPEDREKVWKEIQKGLEKEEYFQVNYRIENKNGQKRWIWERGRGIFDEDGEVKFLEGFIQDVTERKKAEEKLEREKERAQKYLETAEVMMISIDPQGEVIQANRKASEVLGYDKEEIIGKDWFENFVPEEQRGEVRDVHEKFEEGGHPEYYENPVLTKSGDVRTILWHNSTLRDGEGNFVGRLSSGMDITERKESEERLEAFVGAIPDLVVVLDEEGYYEEILTSQHKLLYESREDLLGKCVDEVLPKDTGDRMLDFVQETIESEEVQKFEYSLNLDGDKHWFEARGMSLQREGKSSEHVVSVIRDITLRKQTEKELRKSEEKYRAITEESHDTVFILGENGFLFVNEKGIDMSGYSEEEFYSMDWEELIHPEDREKVREIDSKGREGEEVPMRYEARILTKEDDVVYGDFRITPIEYEGELAVLGTIRDISEQKKLRDRKDFLNTLLRQDLGSKFRIIQGYMQMIDEEADIADELGEYLAESMELGSEANELLGLVKDLEEMEDSEWLRGKDLVNVWRDVVDDSSDLIEDNGVEVEGKVPENISKVKGDFSLSTLLKQLLVTRIRAGECKKIEIGATESEEDILLKLEDDGEQLPEEVKNLFTGEIYRGETTGIGGVRYYILGEIARHNDAKIEVKDSDLGGSRFDVRLRKA